MELLIDVKFDGCVKSHLVVVREGRRESVPFAALCLQSLRGERETLRTHMRFAAPSCKPSLSKVNGLCWTSTKLCGRAICSVPLSILLSEGVCWHRPEKHELTFGVGLVGLCFDCREL